MVVYEGPSMINGEPIVAIITGLESPSKNRKTGPMIQLWILDANEEPHVAVRSGRDESVCGDCPARGKWCYVATFQGPLSIYKTWKRGGYGNYSPATLAGKVLRFGAYGDPAAIPIETIRELGRVVDRFTGYTHAWRYCDPSLKYFCMASCDSVDDQKEASANGWRTFRVSSDIRDRQQGESICPASDENRTKLTCYDCGACDGRARRSVKGHIVIQVHGTQARTSKFIEEMGT